MPKESVGTNNGKATVQWSRDAYVSIGVEKADFSNITIVNNQEGITRQPVEYNSLWTELTRTEINSLIRTLRRARDQAFGRDE